VRAYAIARRRYLADHPICEVWCREHGLRWYEPRTYQRIDDGPDGGIITDLELRIHRSVMAARGIGGYAPEATEVHHMAKRRGARLLDESQWLAVCRANHERIESNKAWARASGWLRDF